MDRRCLPRKLFRSTYALAAALLLCASGCSALATGLWALGGNMAPADFEGLKEKRVAVVCRPQFEMQFATSRAADELAEELGRHLAMNVKKIEVVDHSEIVEWTDEHDWDDFKEIGEAVEADMVVGIELEQYELYRSQTIFQGHGRATIKVYDMEKDGELAYMKQMPKTVYPPNTGVPVNDTSPPEFNRRFVQVMADEIGRYFYAHDPRADFGRDNQALGF